VAERLAPVATDLLERPGVLGRLGDLIQVAPGWEQAVATGLGAAAEAVVATRLDYAISAIVHLAGEDLGRAHVVVSGAVAGEGTPLLELITAPRELRGALSRLLAGIVAVEDLPEAKDVIKTDPSLTAVTRAGDRVSGWLVEGGSTAKPSLLALNADLTETEEQLKRITAEVDRQRFALDAARNALQKARDEEATALAALRPAAMEPASRAPGTRESHHGSAVKIDAATVPSRTPSRALARVARRDAATRRRSRASLWTWRARASSRSVRRARTFLTAGLFIALTSGRRRKILACPLRLQASSAASELNPVARTRSSEE